MHDFRRLEIWQEALDLAEFVYRLTETFPRRERYELVSQIRRAAVSICSNIAEGAGRGGSKEMARYLRMALGSLCELDTQMTLAVRLGFMEEESAPLARLSVLAKRIRRLHDRLTGDRP